MRNSATSPTESSAIETLGTIERPERSSSAMPQPTRPTLPATIDAHARPIPARGARDLAVGVGHGQELVVGRRAFFAHHRDSSGCLSARGAFELARSAWGL